MYDFEIFLSDHPHAPLGIPTVKIKATSIEGSISHFNKRRRTIVTVRNYNHGDYCQLNGLHFIALSAALLKRLPRTAPPLATKSETRRKRCQKSHI